MRLFLQWMSQPEISEDKPFLLLTIQSILRFYIPVYYLQRMQHLQILHEVPLRHFRSHLHHNRILIHRITVLHNKLYTIGIANQIIIRPKYYLRSNLQHRTYFIQAVFPYCFMYLITLRTLSLYIKSINAFHLSDKFYSFYCEMILLRLQRTDSPETTTADLLLIGRLTIMRTSLQIQQMYLQCEISDYNVVDVMCTIVNLLLYCYIAIFII